MRLYLVQHGEALSKETAPERPLSEKGKTDVFKIANFLKGKVKIHCIWHSKKLRAIQTAQIFKEVGIGEDLVEREDLNPLDPVEKLPPEIIKSNLDLMLVGHLPFLASLASLLLSGNEDLNLIKFYPGGVVSLEKEENWRLLWIVIPHLIGE
ncbi:MAG: phosphohistidine phosphatase SixA [Candidatus Omnitrophica bacterium]|nr:phosphohistidine phosphatase SixA [Candidatus Omnitrophota bacterium]